VATRDQLLEKIAGLNIALQGELIGEGIQGNIYKLRGQQFFVYDIFDIAAGRYYTPSERRMFCQNAEIQHVPVLAGCADKDLGTGSVAEILDWAEGKSVLNLGTEREGIVFKCIEDPSIHFKAISNRYLIRTGN
jgi:ATP-dependent RNA circularization protein (DNA/RNA ligase family)